MCRKPIMHHHMALILTIISTTFHFTVLSFLQSCNDPVSPNVINTVSSADFRSSVLLMRQSIPVRQRSGLTLVFGGSAASKHFWAQWSNSLLASVTISWPSLKCKKETQLNLLLFNVLYALCQILYSNLRCCIITHTVLSSSWVKRVFNLSQFLCHW